MDLALSTLHFWVVFCIAFLGAGIIHLHRMGRRCRHRPPIGEKEK